MTRKDFESLARYLAGLAGTYDHDERCLIIQALCPWLLQQNPRFDADKFCHAALYGTDNRQR